MEGQEIINKIREFVKEECKKPSNKYGFEPYINHFVPTAKYVKLLGKENDLNEDQIEILEIAAWLHDIGSIMVGRENHHITSGEIAEEKLNELNYPKEKIIKIKKIIFSHRGSQGIKPKSIEEQILIDADAINDFNHIEGLFKAAYDEGLSQKDARASVKQKLNNSYNKLSEKGKNSIKDKWGAVILLLNENILNE